MTLPTPLQAILSCLLLASCGPCTNTAPGPQSHVQTAPGAAAEPDTALQTHIVIAESPQALVSWSKATDEQRESGEGLIDSVVYGQKIFLRLAVSAYPVVPDVPFQLDGELRLLAPDGALLHEQPAQATAAQLDRDAPGVLILSPGMDVIFDPGDPIGTYSLRGTIHNGDNSTELQHSFEVADGGVQLSPDSF